MYNVKSDPEPKPIENHWFMTSIFYQEIYFKWIMILLDNAPLNLFDLTLQKISYVSFKGLGLEIFLKCF